MMMEFSKEFLQGKFPILKLDYEKPMKMPTQELPWCWCCDVDSQKERISNGHRTDWCFVARGPMCVAKRQMCFIGFIKETLIWFNERKKTDSSSGDNEYGTWYGVQNSLTSNRILSRCIQQGKIIKSIQHLKLKKKRINLRFKTKSKRFQMFSGVHPFSLACHRV